MAEAYLSEFLYRGRSPSDPTPPAWHVNLSVAGDDPLGNPIVVEQQLDMTAAEKAGWGLPKILEGINAEALSEIEALRSAADVQARTLEEALAARDEAVAACLQVTAAADAAVAVFESERAGWEAEKAKLSAEIAALKQAGRDEIKDVKTELAALRAAVNQATRKE